MKKLIASCIGMLLAFGLAACKNSADDDSTPASSSSSNSVSISTELQPAIKGTLGHGYNVFSQYINPTYVRPTRVLDYDKMVETFGLYNKRIARTTYQTRTGSNLSTYQKELSQTVKAHYGVSNVFSASLETNFGIENTGSNESSYASMHTNVEQFSSCLKNVTDASLSKVESCITDEFKQSVSGYIDELKNSKFDPKKIFNEYGTHVIIGGTYGGRYDYYLTTSRVKRSDTFKLSYKVAAEFGKATKDEKGKESGEKDGQAKSGGGSNSGTVGNVDTSDVQTKKTYAEVVGGKNAFSGDLKDPDTYQKWLESVEPEANWVLIGFDEGSNYNGIIPIWEIVARMINEGDSNSETNTNLKNLAVAIGEGYKKYADEQNEKYKAAYQEWVDPNTLGKKCVWDIRVGTVDGTIRVSPNTDGSTEIKSTDGGATVNYNNTVYYKLPVDLNRGASDKIVTYLYVAYCYYSSSKGTQLEDANGEMHPTTLEPLNDMLITENILHYISDNGYTATDKLHGWWYAGEGRSTGSWRIGYKRGTSAPIRDVRVLIDYGGREEAFTGHGPDNNGFVCYGADEVDVKKENRKGKQGQDIGAYAPGRDWTYIYYYCDQ